MKPRNVSFKEIIGTLPILELEKYSPDLIIAVGNGGIPPAALVSAYIAIPLLVLPAKLYDDGKPARKIYEKAKIEAGNLPDLNGKKILFVDDVSNTGETLNEAKKAVLGKGAKEVKAFVVFNCGAIGDACAKRSRIFGKADFSCFKFEKCVKFPWE